MARTQFTTYRIALLILLLFFIWLFTSLAWDLHSGMKTHKADLGQIAQAVWNSSQGRFVEMTDNGPLSSRLTDHVEPILMVVSPALWLWRDVRMLLLLQVVMAAISGWLLYELAVLRFGSLLSQKEQQQIWRREPLARLTAPLALVLALGVCFSPQVQNGLLTEFHAAPLAIPLILWSFYAVEKLTIPQAPSSNNLELDIATRRGYWLQFVVATLLTAMVKEEMALLAAGLSAWALYKLLIQRYASPAPYPSTGTLAIPLVMLLVSTLWFYLATFVIVPANAVEVYNTAENPYWARYGALGESPLDIVRSLFTQPLLVLQIASEPVRANYLWAMLATFGFLSLLAPEILLLSLPLLLANLLSEYPPQYYGEFHYSAPLVAYFGVSAVYGVSRLGRVLMKATSGASPAFQQLPAAKSWVMALVALARNPATTVRPLVFSALALWVLGWNIASYIEDGRGPLGGRHDPVEVTTHHRLLPRFLDQLPPDASVTATAAVHPHVSLRRFVYQFPIGMPEFGEAGDAEWALLDVTTNTDMAPGDLHNMVQQMLAADWWVVDGADGFLLLKQDASGDGLSKDIPSAFYDFARLQHSNSLSTTEATTGTITGRNSGLSTGISTGVTNESASAQPSNTPLTLLEVHVDDWPRWRATKVTTVWQIGTGYNHEIHTPKMLLLEPSGAPLYSFSDGTPTALIWYPPQRWQPGDMITVTTNGLSLPQFWGVVVSAEAVPENGSEPSDSIQEAGRITDGAMTLVASYQRGADSHLLKLALPNDGINMVSHLAETAQWDPQVAFHRFDNQPANGSLDQMMLNSAGFSSNLAAQPVVNVVMRWERETLEAWPPNLTTFVHMRKTAGSGEAETVAQQDGLPRWFLSYAPELLMQQGQPLWDWRQIATSPIDSGGTVDLNESVVPDYIVVGLYDSNSGVRAELLDEAGNPVGSEARVWQSQVLQRTQPDFACAMNPVSCRSQP